MKDNIERKTEKGKTKSVPQQIKMLVLRSCSFIAWETEWSSKPKNVFLLHTVKISVMYVIQNYQLFSNSLKDKRHNIN